MTSPQHKITHLDIVPILKNNSPEELANRIREIIFAMFNAKELSKGVNTLQESMTPITQRLQEIQQEQERTERRPPRLTINREEVIQLFQSAELPIDHLLDNFKEEIDLTKLIKTIREEVHKEENPITRKKLSIIRTQLSQKYKEVKAAESEKIAARKIEINALEAAVTEIKEEISVLRQQIENTPGRILTDNEMQVLAAYFGLNDPNFSGKTYQQIAKDRGINNSRAMQLCNAAMRKFRWVVHDAIASQQTSP